MTLKIDAKTTNIATLTSGQAVDDLIQGYAMQRVLVELFTHGRDDIFFPGQDVNWCGV